MTPRTSIRQLRATAWSVILGSCLVPVSLSAWAGDGDGTTGTVSVLASNAMVGAASVQHASIEVFRPAPMPNEYLAVPVATKPSEDGGPDLHPDVLRTGRAGSGDALSSASNDYALASKMRPAGGLSLSIPMQ